MAPHKPNKSTMKSLLAPIFATTLCTSSCAYVGWDTMRTPVNFQASEFNSVASKYYDRPTSAEIVRFKSGDSYLAIQMDKYGNDVNEIRFVKEGGKEYDQLIEKYLEWESQAKANKDLINKDIGKAKGFANKIKFSIYSANQYSHYLELSVFGTSHQYYDRAAALELRKLLNEYTNDKIEFIVKEDTYK